MLSQAVGHDASFGTHAKLTWMASALVTVAGALGAGLESDEAAYGYRPERQTEAESEA